MPVMFPGKVVLDSYTETVRPLTTRTQMESGPPKQARRRDRLLRQTSIRVLCTAAQHADFLTWYETDVSGGSAFFDYTEPGATTVQARMVGGAIESIEWLNATKTHCLFSFAIETYA